MKPILLLLFSCSVLICKAQRSTWNKADPKYLCDQLNAYFETIARKTRDLLDEKPWNVNDPGLLGDTIAFGISGRPEPYSKLQPAFTKGAACLAMHLFVAGIKEFPQFKAIVISANSTERKEITAIYLIKSGRLLYYDEKQKKWMTYQIAPCNESNLLLTL